MGTKMAPGYAYIFMDDLELYMLCSYNLEHFPTTDTYDMLYIGTYSENIP